MQALGDLKNLWRYAEQWDLSLAEVVKLLRMQYFGAPIARTDWFIVPSPGCIRVKLYPSLKAYRAQKPCLDQADFPLGLKGGLSLRQIRTYWGIVNCGPIDPQRWEVFEPKDPDWLSGLALMSMLDGRRVLHVLWTHDPKDEFCPFQGTIMHELSVLRRMFADDPQWYISRLFAVSLAVWLITLIPLLCKCALWVVDAARFVRVVAGAVVDAVDAAWPCAYLTAMYDAWLAMLNELISWAKPRVRYFVSGSKTGGFIADH
ncbi:hypothetical protein DENSPDRAFT_885162 [Dentipellis sp. KUC8613]|nr:hypothetical protein DENSPDRAFT_885162 [Dentipellis sp. KUC8613]